MRHYFLGFMLALILMLVVWSCIFFVGCAHAQQPAPQDQLAQATAMVSTLYRQLNTAIQDGAAQEAARIKLQQELEQLRAQLAEAKKAKVEGSDVQSDKK